MDMTTNDGKDDDIFDVAFTKAFKSNGCVYVWLSCRLSSIAIGMEEK